MKPTSFNYADYAKMEIDMERKNEYVNVLIAERNQARLDCAVAEANHMRTLERFLEAQERITELTAENNALRNELCLKCGRYREAHNGACNGCRWKEK